MNNDNIIIRYHGANGDFAIQLAIDLQHNGYSVFLDKLAIHPLDSKVSFFDAVIPRANHAIVILSMAYVESPSFHEELSQLLEHNISIVSVLLDDVAVGSMPDALSNYDWFAFEDYSESEVQRFIHRCLAHITPTLKLTDEEIYLLEAIRDTEVYLHNTHIHQVANRQTNYSESRSVVSHRGVKQWVQNGDYILATRDANTQRQDHELIVTNLIEWLKVRSQLILTGQPGCGKTFIARHLYLCTLHDRLETPETNPLPLWISARSWHGQQAIYHVLQETFITENANSIILFIDEVDSLSAGQVNDLTRWLMETNNTVVATARHVDNIGFYQTALSIQPINVGTFKAIIRTYLPANTAQTITDKMIQYWDVKSATTDDIYHLFEVVSWQILLHTQHKLAADTQHLGQLIWAICEYSWQKIHHEQRSTWSLPIVLQRLQALAFNAIDETEYDYFTREMFVTNMEDESLADLMLLMGIVDNVAGAFRFRSATMQNYFAAQQLYKAGIYTHLSYPQFDSRGNYQLTRWDTVIAMLVYALPEIDYPALIENIADVDPFLALHCLTDQAVISPYIQQQIIYKLIAGQRDVNYPVKALHKAFELFNQPAVITYTLVEALNDKDPQVHDLAFSLLSEVNIQIPDVLIDYIENKAHSFPDAVFDILEAFDDKEIITYLIILTTHPHLDIRQNTLWLLGRLQNEAAIPVLIHVLDDDNRDIVNEAVISLSFFKTEQAWKHVLQHTSNLSSQAFAEVTINLTADKRYTLHDLLVLFRETQTPIADDMAQQLAMCADPTLTAIVLHSLSDYVDLSDETAHITTAPELKESDKMIKQLLSLLSNQMESLSNYDAFNEFVKSLSNRQQESDMVTSTQQMKDRVQSRRNITPVVAASTDNHNEISQAPDAVPAKLREALLNDDWETRVEAVRHIARYDTNEALALLLDAAVDEDVQVRIAAIESLSDMRQYPMATETIIKSLDDEDYLVVDRSADILKSYGENIRFRVLLKLNSDKVNTVAAALDVLGVIGDDTVVPTLTKFLNDERTPWVSDKTLRDYAAEALVKLNTPTALKVLHESGYVGTPASEAIIQPDDEVNSQLKKKSTHSSSSFTPLERITIALKALRGADWHQSQKAARYIRAYARRYSDTNLPEVVHLLQDTLTDENWVVRWTATEALAWLKDTDTTDAIIQRLNDDSWIVRVAAVQALVEFEADQTAPIIAQLLSDEETAVREAVIEAIGILQNRDVLPYLLKALNDKNDFVRLASIQAIIALMDVEACNLIAPCVADENHHIRWVTMQHLVQHPQNVDINIFARALRDYDKPQWKTKTISDLALEALRYINTEESLAIITKWENEM